MLVVDGSGDGAVVESREKEASRTAVVVAEKPVERKRNKTEIWEAEGTEY